ncbi:MAG: Na+/H+ antiporter subunit E [Solirubrobacterales bacterium]
MTSRLLAVALLAAIYLLTLGSLDLWDLGAGLLVGAAIAIGLRRFLFAGEPLPARVLAARTIHLPLYVLAVGWEVVRGTWQVALIVAGLRPLRRPGIVAVPIGERSPTGVAVSVLAITLSPGELYVDTDEARGTMLIHVLDADDPDAVRDRFQRFYDRFQRKVFP